MGSNAKRIAASVGIAALVSGALMAGRALAQETPAPPAAPAPAAAPPAAASPPPAAAPAPAPSPSAAPTPPPPAAAAPPAQPAPQTSPAAAPQQPAPKPAPAQASTPPADQLPQLEIIQETPEQRAVRIKRQAAPIAPIAVAPSGPSPAPTAGGGTPSAGTGSSQASFGTEAANKVPNAVYTTTSTDFTRSGDVQATDVLVRTVPGVILSDQQGNDFQKTIDFRGFSSSPVNGMAQGLAVYQNGVRINEAFGDIVNYDFLPSNAIDTMSLVTNNPAFGLNAIGGALVINMRDGFNFEGVEIDVRGGSFGRAQGSLAMGGKSGHYGMFIALEGIDDDGWRLASESKIRRMYADLGFKNSDVELHVNFTGASNYVGATSAAPVQLLDLGWNNVYTNPQTTDNELAMLSVNGSVKASGTLTLGGNAYIRHFKQRHFDANGADAVDCQDPNNDNLGDPNAGGAGDVCFEGDATSVALDAAGNPINIADPNLQGATFEQLGTIDRTAQDAKSFGGTIQAVDTTKLFGFSNQLTIGTSYDHGDVEYTASSELGYYPGTNFVISGFGPAYALTGPDDFLPRDIGTTNDYFGAYISDTIDLTSALSLTVGGRYNLAKIDLQDMNGNYPDITSKHTYERFNPMAGATYKIFSGLTAYGGYSEANRAPTAAELACADPNNPCLIESFLTADPDLNQVVTKTYEAGLRGEARLSVNELVTWSGGYFHALNQDDILAVAAPQGGRGYFVNAGETLRQGVELAINYQGPALQAYAAYAYTRATFETANAFSSPFNPSAATNPPCPGTVADPCVYAVPGNRLPGVPEHRFKAGLDYMLTAKWKIGGDLTVASDQVFFGDEGNQQPTLDGYARLDLHTSYQLTEHMQIYGLLNNVFDSRYGVFGNFFDTETGNAVGNGVVNFTNPQTITPAAPIAAYGGVRIKY